MIASVIITEFLIVLKFDWETVTKPIPRPVACVWLVGLVCLVTWTTFKFYILRDVKNDVPPINGELSWLCGYPVPTVAKIILLYLFDPIHIKVSKEHCLLGQNIV